MVTPGQAGTARPRTARPPRWALAVLAAAVLAAAAAPLLDGGISVVHATGPPLAPPSWSRWLGTDENGRSVLVLTVAGARTSLLVACAATAIAVALGTVMGVLGAVLDGPASWTAGQLTQCFLALPPVPLALVLGAVSGPGATTLVGAIAVTSWASLARVVQAAVVSESHRPHLDRVRALGGGRRHQLRHHVLPAVAPVVTATAILAFANAVLTEAGMSFLGFGGARAVSWGSMLRDASASGALTAGAWGYLLAPGISITVVVSALGACARRLDPAPGH